MSLRPLAGEELSALIVELNEAVRHEVIWSILKPFVVMYYGHEVLTFDLTIEDVYNDEGFDYRPTDLTVYAADGRLLGPIIGTEHEGPYKERAYDNVEEETYSRIEHEAPRPAVKQSEDSSYGYQFYGQSVISFNVYLSPFSVALSNRRLYIEDGPA